MRGSLAERVGRPESFSDKDQGIWDTLVTLFNKEDSSYSLIDQDLGIKSHGDKEGAHTTLNRH